MNTEKLNQIITNKNEQLERDALREAESIIEQIAMQQQAITNANQRILKLHSALKMCNPTQKNHPQRSVLLCASIKSQRR